MAADDELEALGQARVLVLALGQRADLLGVVTDEGRVDERGLAELIVELKDELAGAPVLLPLDIVLLAELAEVLDGGVHIHVLAHGARRDLGQRDGLPGTGHVDGLALVLDDLVTLLTAADLARDGLEQALGQGLHALEVGVGAVGLHRGELGVVREVHALVAELAPDLEDALEAADDAALERELGGDAQVEIAVKSVEVGDEGLGVGAAEDGVHHGGLDLHVAVGLHVAANQADDLAALAEGVANVGVHDEVDVALTVTDLAIGQAVELLGQWTQGLGEDLQVRRGKGELAALGADDGTRRADDVSEVEAGKKRPVLLRQVVHAAEQLDGARDVLEDDEGDLALLAEGADTARERVDVLGALAVGELGVALLELGGVGRHGRVDGIRVDAGVKKRLAAQAALGALVVSCGGGGVFAVGGHGFGHPFGFLYKKAPQLRVCSRGAALS